MPEIHITLMPTEPTGSLVTCVGDSELGSLTCYKTGTTFTRTPRDRKGLHPFRILSTEAKELKASPHLLPVLFLTEPHQKLSTKAQ